MTPPRSTAQILASPLAAELLHAVADSQATATPAGYRLYPAIDVEAAVRRLAADHLLEPPPGPAPILTARGEDAPATV